ncbi:MAG: transposase [Limnoraphis sp. WC205]|nr:transposase [Limnoraphis sp. WC205]
MFRRYTSQKCNVCKHIKRTNRSKSRFCCNNCGHQTHADLNAAKNVRLGLYSLLYPEWDPGAGVSQCAICFGQSFCLVTSPLSLVRGAVDFA